MKTLIYCKFVTVCSAGLFFHSFFPQETVFQRIEYDSYTHMTYCDCTLFLSPKFKADTVEAAAAETEEAADCEQSLQKETQRQEETESSLQMLGVSPSEVL